MKAPSHLSPQAVGHIFSQVCLSLSDGSKCLGKRASFERSFRHLERNLKDTLTSRKSDGGEILEMGPKPQTDGQRKAAKYTE